MRLFYSLILRDVIMLDMSIVIWVLDYFRDRDWCGALIEKALCIEVACLICCLLLALTTFGV